MGCKTDLLISALDDWAQSLPSDCRDLFFALIQLGDKAKRYERQLASIADFATLTGCEVFLNDEHLEATAKALQKHLLKTERASYSVVPEINFVRVEGVLVRFEWYWNIDLAEVLYDLSDYE